MEGSLSKWTNVMKGWQYRWFVLDDNAGLLSYYTSREKMVKGARRGCVRLKGAVIGIDDEDNTTFTITVDGKTFHFQARNCEERERWIRYLEDTVIRHEFGCHSSASSVDYSRLLAPSINHFDKKVAEADAYLQLLIDQVQALEKRAEQIQFEQEKEICEIIITNSKMMLEEIKHTIVLLQIAKNSAFPVDGTYRPERDTSSLCSLPNDVFTDNRNNDIEMGIEIDDLNRSLPMFRFSVPANYTYSSDIPDTSYSSSDEENYYDARENDYQNDLSSSEDMNNSSEDTPSDDIRHNVADCSPNVTPKRNPSISTNDTIASSNDVDSRRESLNVIKTSSNSPVVPLLPDGSIDFDALYEDPSENEQSQPSVIKHLISQVKIGMDLTKVVLPTFILERRSLLEMYSDYFAHPDIFLKAVDLATPKDRMIQIVKWYLSSYHAGRKSSVAKKPYNPVLGEMFRCWWDVNDIIDDDNDCDDQQQSMDPDGPISWCTNDQLLFIAEQVSHHPPISAFYAEHVSKRVSLCAHLWTKSKFLGLSVCVYNIGQAVVRLLDHKEEYISTFPNGYGRSILTVPWIELGGSTSIKCPQTGYFCNIEFLTKPFYGGKKHRISADIFGPKDKKPFLTISGEWNGVMEAKWIDGSTEIFLDTRKMSVNKKKVKKIEEQEDNESRKIWKMVTLGLKYNDVEQATNAKMQIEQKQRDEAQLRKGNSEVWKPKWFYEEDGAWWYKNPLEKRLNINFDRNNSIN